MTTTDYEGRRITTAEYLVYLKRVVAYKNENHTHRLGQCYFNVLHRDHEDLASEFRGQPLDPYYDDKKIPEFLTFLFQEYVK